MANLIASLIVSLMCMLSCGGVTSDTYNFTDSWSKVREVLQSWTNSSYTKEHRYYEGDFDDNSPEAKDFALRAIEDIAHNNMGYLCATENFRGLPVYLPEVTERYLDKCQEADMAASLVEKIGINHRNEMLSVLLHKLIDKDESVLNVRAIALDPKSALVVDSLCWHAEVVSGRRVVDRLEGPAVGRKLGPEPWFRPAVSSTGVPMPMRATHTQRQSWWSLPYYSCAFEKWLISYGVDIPPVEESLVRGFLGVDFDLSEFDVNQCDEAIDSEHKLQVTTFLGTHKCPNGTSVCEFQSGMRWSLGAYRCHCKPGYYSIRPNTSLVEVSLARSHDKDKESLLNEDQFQCLTCAEGCQVCSDSAPCLANYSWTFRITLLAFSSACIASTVGLLGCVYRYRGIKEFNTASPIWFGIILLGCATMYMEMVAIFPVAELCSCIATKWTRHMGFGITYTSLMAKIWRVNVAYIKSDPMVKLTDKKVLQRIIPILIVMLIYLVIWTLVSSPNAEDMHDSNGLIFKQCTYNWWDHFLAIGEVLVLGWGIKGSLNVRNVESLVNEVRLTSYAIYNLALVNITTVVFHLLTYQTSGPDTEYFLQFIATQLSATVTIGFVFGPKVVRMMKGQGFTYDNCGQTIGVTESLSLDSLSYITVGTTALGQMRDDTISDISFSSFPKEDELIVS